MMAAAASTTELILDEVFRVCVSKFVCLSVVSCGMSFAVCLLPFLSIELFKLIHADKNAHVHAHMHTHTDKDNRWSRRGHET